MKRLGLVSTCVCVGLLGCGERRTGSGSLERAVGDVRHVVVLRSEKFFERSSFSGVRIERRFRHVFPGFAATLRADQARALRSDPDVESVVPVGRLSLAQVQSQRNPPWNLDRLDQASRGADRQYRYRSDGRGVRAYVVDTGIDVSHPDFGGRAEMGIDVSADAGTPLEGKDSHGHGTHVAGILGSATYGVAKAATLVSVKVFDVGARPVEDDVFLAGMEWAIADHMANPGPAVMNVSIAGDATATVDAAIRSAVDAGIVVVVAAGNKNKDACLESPAREPSAITVAATMMGDERAYFSNWGKCVDMLAPGSRIVSTYKDGKTYELAGTSMAAPHVAGLAALHLALHPGKTPREVGLFLSENSSRGVILGLPPSTPNLMASAAWNAR